MKTFELRYTENDWIKINQEKFEDNKLEDLKRELNVIVMVIVDNENLLKCEGRHQYTLLPYDSKTHFLLKW